MPRNALLDAYLTDTEQELLVNLMTEVIVDADEVVIRQGEVGNNFFLIAEGECTVSIDDVDIGHPLTAGDNCGEIGLIEQTTRTATVTAVRARPTRACAGVPSEMCGHAHARPPSATHCVGPSPCAFVNRPRPR
jgi:CRP-like cAMP-binding protein